MISEFNIAECFIGTQRDLSALPFSPRVAKFPYLLYIAYRHSPTYTFSSKAIFTKSKKKNDIINFSLWEKKRTEAKVEEEYCWTITTGGGSIVLRPIRSQCNGVWILN